MTGQIGFPIGFACAIAGSYATWWFVSVRPLPPDMRRKKFEQLRRRTVRSPSFYVSIVGFGLVVPAVAFRDSTHEMSAVAWILLVAPPFVFIIGAIGVVEKVFERMARSRGFTSVSSWQANSDTSTLTKIVVFAAYFVPVLVFTAWSFVGISHVV